MSPKFGYLFLADGDRHCDGVPSETQEDEVCGWRQARLLPIDQKSRFDEEFQGYAGILLAFLLGGAQDEDVVEVKYRPNP